MNLSERITPFYLQYILLVTAICIGYERNKLVYLIKKDLLYMMV